MCASNSWTKVIVNKFCVRFRFDAFTSIRQAGDNLWRRKVCCVFVVNVRRAQIESLDKMRLDGMVHKSYSIKLMHLHRIGCVTKTIIEITRFFPPIRKLFIFYFCFSQEFLLHQFNQLAAATKCSLVSMERGSNAEICHGRKKKYWKLIVNPIFLLSDQRHFCSIKVERLNASKSAPFNTYTHAYSIGNNWVEMPKNKNVEESNLNWVLLFVCRFCVFTKWFHPIISISKRFSHDDAYKMMFVFLLPNTICLIHLILCRMFIFIHTWTRQSS